jgi:hypothetical protein
MYMRRLVNRLVCDLHKSISKKRHKSELLISPLAAPSSMGHNFRTDSTWKPGMRMALESSSVDGDLHRTRSGYTLPDQLSGM